MTQETTDLRLRPDVVLGLVALAGLVLAHQLVGYTLFHVLVELFAVVVAFGIFIVTWNTRHLLDNGYLLVIGIAFLFVGGVDLLHTLAYKGMGGLLGADEIDVPTQLWLVARYLQAGAFLVAPSFLHRTARPRVVVTAFAAVTLTAVASVLWWDVFPTALTPTGLTPFKVASEYVISALLVAAAALLWRNRARFERDVLGLLLGAIAATIASEMAFTLYADPFGALNMVGHFLKVLAFYLIYKALVETALQRPFNLLFREIREREAALAESEERFRTTFEQATVGIAHIGLDGRWLRVNQRLSQITGYGHDELLRLGFRDLTHPEDVAEDVTGFDRLVAGETDEYSLEKRIVRKDGTQCWVWVRRSLLRDATGRPKYVMAVLEDIDWRKRAEERLRRSKDLSEAMTRVDAAINSTLDQETILQRAMVGAAEAIGCETASVTRKVPEGWMPVAQYRFPRDIVGRLFPDAEVPHAALAAETLAPVAISNAYDDERVNPEVMRRYEIRSVLVVPLVAKGVCVGSVYFNFHTHTHWFTEDELAFATSLASALSLAMENADLYAAERRIATTLQSALLSIPAGLPRVDLAAEYRARDELDRIGGDFYDAFDLGGGLVAFALGDVSGKGLDAANITAVARSTIRAFAYVSEDPARVLCETNTVLERHITDDRFVTVLYGTLDTSSGRLTLCSAGHPGPVICGPGQCEYLQIPPNPPLGAFPESTFEQVTALLSPGEMLVLYSDGVLDARRGDDFFGEERLTAVLAGLVTLPTAEVVTATLRAVDEFAGGARTDDAAVAAIRLIASSVTGTSAAHVRPTTC